MNNLIIQWAEDLKRHYTKEDVEMSNEYTKQCTTTLYVMRELPVKITRYHYTPVRIVHIQNTDKTKFWQACAARTFILCWWEWKMVQAIWKTIGSFLHIKCTLTV